MADETERTVRGWNDRNERAAGDLLVRALGGTYREIDPGGGPVPLHDLELTTGDGRRVAVEVTQHVDPLATRTLAAIQRTNWHLSGLRFGWYVNCIDTFNVTQLRRELGRHLSVLEDTNQQIWLAPRPRDQPSETDVRLERLGVRHAHRGDHLQPGEVVIGRSSFGRWVNADDIAETASEHASRPDNKHKLSAATADERWLFIWVDPLSTDAAAAMAADELPVGAPRSPAFINRIWLAQAHEEPDLWCWDRSTGWSIFRASSDASGATTSHDHGPADAPAHQD